MVVVGVVAVVVIPCCVAGVACNRRNLGAVALALKRRWWGSSHHLPIGAHGVSHAGRQPACSFRPFVLKAILLNGLVETMGSLSPQLPNTEGKKDQTRNGLGLRGASRIHNVQSGEILSSWRSSSGSSAQA